MNVMEHGEHQLQEVAYSQFEPLDGENGGRTMKFHGKVESRAKTKTGGRKSFDSR